MSTTIKMTDVTPNAKIEYENVKLGDLFVDINRQMWVVTWGEPAAKYQTYLTIVSLRTGEPAHNYDSNCSDEVIVSLGVPYNEFVTNFSLHGLRRVKKFEMVYELEPES